LNPLAFEISEYADAETSNLAVFQNGTLQYCFGSAPQFLDMCSNADIAPVGGLAPVAVTDCIATGTSFIHIPMSAIARSIAKMTPTDLRIMTSCRHGPRSHGPADAQLVASPVCDPAHTCCDALFDKIVFGHLVTPLLSGRRRSSPPE
jgi:hypothetical protein